MPMFDFFSIFFKKILIIMVLKLIFIFEKSIYTIDKIFKENNNLK